MKISDKLNELSYLSYFILERRKTMKNFILGSIIGVLVVSCLGSTYLLYKGGNVRVRRR